MRKRVLILGGGISGLALAYFLKISTPRVEVTVVEKYPRAGGKIGTDLSKGYVFEKGPCLFKTAGQDTMLQLMQMLGLHKDIVMAEPPYLDRYFTWKNKVEKVSFYSWDLWMKAFKEMRTPPHVEDESVWDFATRRFGNKITKKYFEPIIEGYCGGDIKTLSAECYAHQFKQAERMYNSFFHAYFRQLFHRKKAGEDPIRQFYFPKGSQMLVGSLAKALSKELLLDHEVKEIVKEGEVFKVETSQGTLEGDILCSALPCGEIGALYVPELLSIPQIGVTSVQLGYRKKVLPKYGYGYFFPPGNPEGAIKAQFDSVVMPQQNQRGEETRINVMLKLTDMDKEKSIRLAMDALHHYLKIAEIPQGAAVSFFENGIPHFGVGHTARMEALERNLQTNFYLVGNYLEGTQSHHCVARAKMVAKKIVNKLVN